MKAIIQAVLLLSSLSINANLTSPFTLSRLFEKPQAAWKEHIALLSAPPQIKVEDVAFEELARIVKKLNKWERFYHSLSNAPLVVLPFTLEGMCILVVVRDATINVEEMTVSGRLYVIYPDTWRLESGTSCLVAKDGTTFLTASFEPPRKNERSAKIEIDLAKPCAQMTAEDRQEFKQQLDDAGFSKPFDKLQLKTPSDCALEWVPLPLEHQNDREE